jgi:hypothetical protein
MKEGIALLIVFVVLFLLGFGVFAGLYYWYDIRKHTTPNGGGGGGGGGKVCNCPVNARDAYNIQGWEDKIKSACEGGLTPTCIQRQKIVCEEYGGCFDNTYPHSPWCYKCGPQKIIIPPHFDMMCSCDPSRRKNYTGHIPGWNEKIKDVCKPGTMTQACIERQRSVCTAGGGCFDNTSGGPWCYYCD